jgi:hypothetical protein
MYLRAKYKPDSDQDWRLVPDPAATIKYDGGNYFVSINSEGKPSYISRRQGVKGNYPDRTSSLPQLGFSVPDLAGHIYNVELIHSGFSKNNTESHSTVSGILNSLSPRAIETQSRIGPVRAVLHNVLNPDFPTYKDKLEHLKKVERLIAKPDLIFVPEVHTSPSAIEALISNTKARGQEGIIVASLSKFEHSNPRTKIKHVVTFNLIVSNVIQERDKNGALKESMGSLELMDGRGNIVGYVGTGFSAADRRDAWVNRPHWINKMIQVKTMGFAKNALRMPVYNGDADGEVDIVGL